MAPCVVVAGGGTAGHIEPALALADAVRRLRVTGAYRAGDAAGLARGLAAAFNLDVRTDADGNLSLSLRIPAR